MKKFDEICEETLSEVAKPTMSAKEIVKRAEANLKDAEEIQLAAAALAKADNLEFSGKRYEKLSWQFANAPRTVGMGHIIGAFSSIK